MKPSSSPLTTHHSPLPTPHSPLPTPHSPLTLLLLLLTIHHSPLTARADVPGKRLDLDINWQQLLALPSLDIQQGASMRLVVRPKLSGVWLDLSGITARWEARSVMSAAATYTATSGTTTNLLHEIWIDLDTGETGAPLTNWLYSIIFISGGSDYPIGTGVVNVVSNGFTGSATTVTNPP